MCADLPLRAVAAGQNLLTWARAVQAMAEVRSKLHKTAEDEARIEALQSLLSRERLKVEMFVARRMAADNARLRERVNHARRTTAMAPPRTCCQAPGACVRVWRARGMVRCRAVGDRVVTCGAQRTRRTTWAASCKTRLGQTQVRRGLL